MPQQAGHRDSQVPARGCSPCNPACRRGAEAGGDFDFLRLGERAAHFFATFLLPARAILGPSRMILLLLSLTVSPCFSSISHALVTSESPLDSPGLLRGPARHLEIEAAETDSTTFSSASVAGFIGIACTTSPISFSNTAPSAELVTCSASSGYTASSQLSAVLATWDAAEAVSIYSSLSLSSCLAPTVVHRRTRSGELRLLNVATPSCTTASRQ